MLDKENMKGTEYYPQPTSYVVQQAQSSPNRKSPKGSPVTPLPAPIVMDKTPIPYITGMRISKETVIYKPPPIFNHRYNYGGKLSIVPPLITVQVEVGPGASNFHEVAKNVIVDPETQLTLPSWELRTPSTDELKDEKKFEQDEGFWDDQYWAQVAKYRKLREIMAKSGSSTATGTAGSIASSKSQKTASSSNYQRADSYRREPKVPPSATGPTSESYRRRVKAKSSLPVRSVVAAKKSGTASNSVKSSEASSLCDGMPPLHLEELIPTAPATPLHCGASQSPDQEQEASPQVVPPTTELSPPLRTRQVVTSIPHGSLLFANNVLQQPPSSLPDKIKETGGETPPPGPELHAPKPTPSPSRQVATDHTGDNVDHSNKGSTVIAKRPSPLASVTATPPPQSSIFTVDDAVKNSDWVDFPAVITFFTVEPCRDESKAHTPAVVPKEIDPKEKTEVVPKESAKERGAKVEPASSSPSPPTAERKQNQPCCCATM